MAQAARRRLDRKARIAVIIAAALLVAGPVLLIGRLVLAGSPGPVHQAFHPENDQLVMLRDGSTMLIRHSAARRIAEWMKFDKKGEESFEVGNRNFAPRSATLTHDGWEHLVQFAQLLKTHSAIRAVVLFSPHHGDPDTARLEQMRADRIRDEVLKHGVNQAQITVSQEGYEANHNAAKDEGLEVVLTNKG